ncbi:Protein transport protein sec73 [Cladobotryum mycophilum]|uniref:Protein transport protein sec73 n=1 Tax=Cladobotryum mycophilum TaxID=491253 RepID=A0ABR0SVP9_9HYPO
MPFLRRRGNMVSETDMRRHTNVSAPPISEDKDTPNLPNQSQQSSDDTETLSQQESRESATSRPSTPPVQHQTNKHRRFSVLRFRNASDSQLSLRVKQLAEKPPPVPRPPPAIITTAPTNDLIEGPKKMSSRMGLASRFRRSADIPRDEQQPSPPSEPQTIPEVTPIRKSSFADDARRPSLNTSDEPHSPRPSTQATIASNGTGLGISANRPSESSRSDVSSTDRVSQSSPNATPKKSRPTTPFFKLRRARKHPEPLFPLAHLQQSSSLSAAGSATSLFVEGTPRPASAQSASTHRGQNGHAPYPSPAVALFAPNGGRSGHSSPTRANLLRGRSSTMSSIGRDSTDDHLLPPTTRTSSSTGRKSFGDLLGLSRLRQTSELSRQGSLTSATPGSVASKSNSLQLPRDTVVLPERFDDESPAKYIARLEGVVSRGVIAAALSKGTDSFSTAALRSYMRTFSFFGDPMDMAIRKLLMDAELPKETQQIDRCLQAFANRYHECNPGIYSSPDQAYFIAFSLLILHTDVFNKNNKHKMQKTDYLKNTNGEGIFDDVLECFYDNICYTPFIHVEDDLELSTERIPGSKSKRKHLLSGANGEPAKRAIKEPIDPYTLIIDGNLDVLRPNLRDAMPLEDQYNYLGSAKSLNLKDLQKTFFRTGVLQIVSARSRPDAFLTDKTATNPDDTHPGIVDIKITKVGLLWRKEAKKRKTRSPWQEWGAILTGAQLYFFRNTSWVKNLMHQYENHIKAGHDGIPITFKPPLEEFKPDALMSTDGAVALLDTSYKKHKNAFIYLNDWIAKLNYAAAFRTSGVRMRGVVGGNYDGQGRRGFRRLDSSDATQLIQTPTGLVSVARSRIDHKMAEDIQIARRDIMRQKIAEADRKMDESKKALDDQLRNARHLQILAPIQPRTRDQLLSAAARMSAQLKWTRIEIWREKCHRDILALDLEEDHLISEQLEAAANSESSYDLIPGPIPRPSVITRSESKTNLQSIAEISQSPMDNRLSSISIPAEYIHDIQKAPVSPIRPSSAPRLRNDSQDFSTSRTETESARHGSVSSVTGSVQSPSATPQAIQETSRDGDNASIASKPGHSHDDVDADERQFLKQAGLLESRTGRDPTDKLTTSTSGEAMDQYVSGDREKFERNKIRRSLQRTLRESAGHLSHHRSKKGREINPAVSSEDSVRDSTLARGTGSFVVHGKKASVIHLGSEIQILSNEEQILARKQQQQQQIQRQLSDQPASPVLNGPQDDDMVSIVETPTESHEFFERRESAASASTATARSFRDLHRKYSSAQAARSVSAAGRLAIPSDGESEAAVSFSDGRRSPLPPIETEEEDNGYTNALEYDDEDTTMELDKEHEEKTLEEKQQLEDSEQESDAESTQEPETLPSRPLQAVNA